MQVAALRRLFRLVACELQKLAQNGIDLFDIPNHCTGSGGIEPALAQLDIEAQPHERRAQVMRDASQHEPALGIQSLQYFAHLIETAAQLPYLLRAFHRDRLRYFPPADSARGLHNRM